MPPYKLEDMVTKRGYIVLDRDLSVKQALAHWKKVARAKRTSYVIFVVDGTGQYKGVVELKNLFLEPKDAKLGEIMIEDFVHVRSKASVSEALSLAVEQEVSELPVVGERGQLVGVVKTEKLVDTLDWMNAHNVYRLAGILKTHEDGDFSLRHILQSVGSRIVWLLFSVIVGVFVAGGIIKQFETAIVTVPAVTFFIPVLMGFGGNIGTQTSTIFVRTLAKKEASVSRRLLRLLVSDLLVGLILGVLLGGVTAGSAMLLFTNRQLALVLFISMVSISLFAILIGFLIPYASYRCKWDPAIVSAPMVTTVKDLVALLIYFTTLKLLM